MFEAIGRVDTVELAIEALPLGGTAVLVGLTPFEARASFGVYPLVDGSRRILGSNYGFADPATDFPRYAALHLAGRLPAERLIDRRIGLDDLEGAFDRLRAGEGSARSSSSTSRGRSIRQPASEPSSGSERRQDGRLRLLDRRQQRRRR